MRLYATPLSHFSRKVRILLDLYAVPYEFFDVGNVAEGDLATFAGNPLFRVPVLQDEANWLIESDHIAQYLVQKFDERDTYQVGTRHWPDLNARAVLNGMMNEEVKLIIARRTGLPTEQYVFFENAIEALQCSFQWLEQNSKIFVTERPRYLDFHLLCLWEHIEYYDFMPLEYPKLAAIVKEVSCHPVLQKSNPARLKAKIFPNQGDTKS